MNLMKGVVVGALVAIFGCNSTSNEPQPMVINTIPKNGDIRVDPGLEQISVTFSEAMLDESWSWVHAAELPFPEAAGEPFFDAARRTASLPVTLKPKTRYEIRINSEEFQNFKSEKGVSAVPYILQFETG